MTIYDVVADCKALNRLISEETDPETGELRELSESDAAEIMAWIEENNENLETKFNGIYKAYRNKQAEAEVAEAERKALKDESDRLGKRAKARESEAGRIKGLFAYAMERLKMRKYKTGLFSIGWQATAKSAKPNSSFNAGDIPVEFLKRELSPSAVTAAVKEGRLYEKEGEFNRGRLFYLENGVEHVLKGVSYLGGETLVVR